MPTHEEPVVEVSLGTIYKTLLDMKQAVDPLPKQVSDHEVRIRAIEKYLWIWIGASAVVGAVAGQILSPLFTR